MNHAPSWLVPPVSALLRPSPLAVESLARAIMRSEHLPLRELPRCRREVRLQLRLCRQAVAPGPRLFTEPSPAPASARGP